MPNALVEMRRMASQKPSKSYEICELIAPDGLYIDIFGRWVNRRHGWTLFGNDVLSMDDQDDK